MPQLPNTILQKIVAIAMVYELSKKYSLWISILCDEVYNNNNVTITQLVAKTLT